MGSMKDTRNFNPFPGLRPFSPEESDLFFGRESESREVVDKLLNNRFVTVIGASGTGKSSLIYCGVLPGVKKSGTDTEGWKIITFRPGNDPFSNLATSIEGSIKGASNGKTTVDNILLDLHLNQDGIALTLKKYVATGNEKILLVIDQFEEIFRYGTASAGGDRGGQAAEFVSKVVSAVGSKVTDIFTIITMRSDFIGECAHYQGLTQLINNSNYLVPHMDRENYRQAIIGPVNYAGASIDQVLVETILSDIGERTDQLPVLQHAMMRTWTYWQELDDPSRPLSKSDYDSVGTMSDAMSRHANEAFEELSPRGKEICEKMFKSITEKGSDNKGIRHPSSVETIKSIVQCTSVELFQVVEKFRIPSRSFITPRQNVPLSDSSIIDLSHESLMRLWDRLRTWVDDEAASVQMYLRLSEASAMYQQGKTSLWRPPDLQLAINWRDQHKPTLAWAQRYDPAFERAMVYLRTSEKEYLSEEESKIRLQKRQMKRAKIVAIILGTAAIISLGFMLFAFVQRIAAENQRRLAETNAQKAREQEQIATIQSDSASKARARAEQSAIIAKTNEELARKSEANAKYQQTVAEKNATLASKNEKLALEQSDSAQKARARAVEQANIATQERNNAERLRKLSIGKAMSIKSLQVQEKDLKTLLAYQAYLFNKSNGGEANDADIYNGLYNVAKAYGNVNYKSFKGQTGEIKSIAFVPGKNEFYTSSGADGRILKWTTEGTNQTFQVVYSGTEIIEVLAVSPDAGWLALGESGSKIHIIPLKGDSQPFDLMGHKGKINSLVFSFDGKFLYSAAIDGKVLRWDIAAKTNTDVSTGAIKITSIDISSRGNYLAGISSDGNVVVWNPDRVNDNFRLETTGRNIKVIKFKPDANILAIGDVNGNVELWDVSTKKQISQVRAHTAQINDIEFNSTFKQMATASNDKTLKIFNITDLTDLTIPPITLSDNEGFVMVMQFSPDGQLIVSGNYQGSDNLVARPSHVDFLIRDICTLVTRNMSQEEWNTYVGRDIPLEATCQEKSYNIKVNAIK